MKKICVIGMGYVGLPLAVEFGKLRSVLGFDIDETRLSELREGFDKTQEIDSSELASAIHLDYSSNEKSLKDCEIFIITVPTPIDYSKRPDLRPLIMASKMVGKIIKAGSIVIYESTVYPGCTEEVCMPILEEVSGLKFNVDFFCGYSPERANPGDKVNTLTTITKITSGSNLEVAQEIDDLYSSIIKSGTYKTENIKTAEAAKVIENSQRDLNIAFVNELSVIFERLGIDTTEVLKAANTKWNFMPFLPGMVGGHCIGVDPYYLTHKAEEVGYNPQVILAGRRINDNMANYVAQRIIRLMIKNEIKISNSTIGIMGFTFKENCPDIRNTKIIDLIHELENWGLNVVVNDPIANPISVAKEYNINLVTLNEFIALDSLVVAVGHNEYRSMLPFQLKMLCKAKKPILADIKAIYDKQEVINAGFLPFRL